MRPIIITADDFGLALEVNEAVEQAHRDGVLSAASLMMTGPAAQDAVRRARKMPQLRVGLHVAVVQSLPLLPPALLPDLVGPDGRLPNGLTRASFAWALRPGAAEQLRAEVFAQFAAFAASGLAFDHVNTHNHMHMNFMVLSAVLAAARQYKVPALRIPRQPSVYGSARGLRILSRYVRHKANLSGLVTNDWVGGLSDTGGLNAATLQRLLKTMPSGVVEIYGHPATHMTPALREAWGADYDGVGELAGLCDPDVQRCVNHLGLRPCGYVDLPRF